MSKNSKERRAVVLAVIALNRLPVMPHWARWIAQDENGEWWAYETKPEIRLGKHEWNQTYKDIESGAQILLLVPTLIPHPPPKDWTKEIYRL